VAAKCAFAGIRSCISPDEVVLAVKEVGDALSAKYRERSTGELAVTRDGKDVARRFAEACGKIFVQASEGGR
jgi:L-serine dehydratase